MSAQNPIPYEQEKAMDLWMKLHHANKMSVPDGEQIGIIKRAIEEVVHDIKADCKEMHATDSLEINRLKAKLEETDNLLKEEMGIG